VNRKERENLQRVSFVIVIMLFVASSISAIRVNAIPGGEPPLEDILDSVGYTQRTLLSTETFAPCTYKITMYAEYAGFRDSNQLRWYKVGTSTFNLIFDGPEGVPPGDPMGMVSPPLTKSFMIGDSFGLSLLSPDGTFYTETTKNIDAQKHAKIYQSQTDPNVYLVGFENMGAQSHSDFDYNDMVVSLEKIQYYLTVKTDPTGVATVPGEGWYDASATATLTAPPVSGNYRFSNWDVDGTSQGSNVNPIGVTMNGPHTATAHYILVNVPALWISPKTNVFSGPCIVSASR
jgi:hypothetical protein